MNVILNLTQADILSRQAEIAAKQADVAAMQAELARMGSTAGASGSGSSVKAERAPSPIRVPLLLRGEVVDLTDD